MLDPQIRAQFPALQRRFNDMPVAYLDSAATYLKPQSVIDAVGECYREMAGTIGRAVHNMAEEATEQYSLARETIAEFINADADEIVFVRSATEALNLVANSLPSEATVIGPVGEHHSNLLPWRETSNFHPVALQDSGRINLELFEELLSTKRPMLAAFSTVSNAFGTLHPEQQLTELAHEHNCHVLLDANQSIAHERLDVRELDCEYLCFSSHKLGGPTGVGVLFAKQDQLEQLKPQLLGGGMVESVGATNIDLAELPMRLEAGTPAFEGVIGLAAACEFLEEIGQDKIRKHEEKLSFALFDALAEIPKVNLIGDRDDRTSIVSFRVEGIEAHSVARILTNRANLCLRSGFHCAELAHHSLGQRPTVRASFGMYNTMQEVELLAATLREVSSNLF